MGTTALLASIIAALIQVESGGTTVIAFHDGHSPSYGCAQIKMRTAKEVAPGMAASELFDCKRSAEIAAIKLQADFEKYGTWRKALCRYNTGRPFADCAYARKVLHQWATQND
jgi:hypothetical protein